jgi:hypothetical protein
MSKCLSVDSDDEVVQSTCVMDSCRKRFAGIALVCSSCAEKGKKSADEYKKSKGKYIAYKKSQESCIGFGKYKEKTVEWLIENDISYCKWLVKKNFSKALSLSSHDTYQNQPIRIAAEIAKYFNKNHIDYEVE